MTAGGLLQLAARGTQDIYLTGNPQITYFVFVYKRHSNFAYESNEQLFTGSVNFGQHVWCDIDREGDLMNEIFLEVHLPSLNPFPDNNPNYHCSWTNAIGHALIKKVNIEIGGQKIDEHYGQWLDIWSELTISNDKKDGYNNMVGKHENFNSTTQEGELVLFIPLQFWFCQNKGLALPLIALQHHNVRINLQFEEFDKLWVSNNGNKPGLGGDNSSFRQNYSISLARLFVDYIYLDEAERKIFAQNNHEYLISQLQVNSVSLPSDVYSLNLEFNHPVKEFIWVIQTQDIATVGPNSGNDWFNYSNGDSFAPKDPLDKAKFELEGTERIPWRKERYFRIVQPYQRHTSVPDNFIYLYSFAYEPESHQPSGTCNFSHIDNAVLFINTIKNLNKPIINIYATNYNVLTISNGQGGIKFNN